jgi:hypothetical protein
MIHSLMRKYPVGSNPAIIKAGCAQRATSRVLALVVVSIVLLPGHSFAHDMWQAPPEQPEQMSSAVHYDPKLSDRFFESDEWICPYGFTEPVTCRDGKPVRILNNPCESWLSLIWPEMCSESAEWTCQDGCKECATCQDGKPVTKVTARCYSTSSGSKHRVNFCKARLLDGHVIEILIHKSRGAFSDALKVRISGGKFACQFWTPYEFGGIRWTTTQQKLTLDKKTYQKGDVIKGRIDFECLSEWQPEYAAKFGRDPRTIKVYGVFKTAVE